MCEELDKDTLESINKTIDGFFKKGLEPLQWQSQKVMLVVTLNLLESLPLQILLEKIQKP